MEAKIKIVSKLDKKVGAYIRLLQKRKCIKRYIVNGYIAFDPNEYEKYVKVAKRGRPIKE